MKIRLSQYTRREFAPGSEPDPRTVKAAILRGDLPGKLVRVGGQWYVESNVATGNEVADRILGRVAS